MCFEKMLWGISEMVSARAFKPSAIVFSTPENLLVGISGALEMKESHFLSYNMFSEHAVEYPSEMVYASRDFWSSSEWKKAIL